MQINGLWYQPLFLWEGLFNLLGLLLIFIAAEYIPKKKAGDLSAAYILWYGILRLSLEPLRNHQYTFTTTYVMSGLWVGIATIILLANHTVLPKSRNYNIRYVIWAPIYKLFTLSFVNKQKDPARYEHYLTRYNQYRERWIRKDNELLYYFGR
jgi:phosphatidylglycerol:prolipoprotein diacylglycerol transferase